MINKITWINRVMEDWRLPCLVDMVLGEELGFGSEYENDEEQKSSTQTKRPYPSLNYFQGYSILFI